MVRIQVKVSDAVYAFLKERTEETGQSLSALCAFYITEYIDSKRGLSSLSDMVEAYKREQDKQSKATGSLPKP